MSVSNISQIGLGLAFLAGLASFLSPCVLPLVPIYLAQLVGQSVYQSTNQHYQEDRLKTFLHAAIFVLGFTLAFVALGASASSLGSILKTNQFLLQRVGGVILIILGLHIAGILKLPFLYTQKRFNFQPARPGYPASLLTGVIFGFAWTPCVGPILGGHPRRSSQLRDPGHRGPSAALLCVGIGHTIFTARSGTQSGQYSAQMVEATSGENRIDHRHPDGRCGNHDLL
jgi:cytochrome c biogenesis protein CcdA